jgi:hypothetical protein
MELWGGEEGAGVVVGGAGESDSPLSSRTSKCKDNTRGVF